MNIESLITLIAQVSLDPDIPMNVPNEGSVQSLLRIFFGVLAGVAVLVITIASLLFALSRGQPDKTARARNAIIYAVVALAVALAAQAFITFVIGNT